MQTNQPSVATVTCVYIGYYLAIALVMNIALWGLERFGGIMIEANAVGWMPLILGAMFAGQYYGARTGVKPPQTFAWIVGLVFMLVSVVLSVAVLFVVASVLGLNIGATLASLRADVGGDAGLIAGIVGGLLVLIWVAQRFMFSTGAGAAIKQAQRLAAKGK